MNKLQSTMKSNVRDVWIVNRFFIIFREKVFELITSFKNKVDKKFHNLYNKRNLLIDTDCTSVLTTSDYNDNSDTNNNST